jgi:hypothetical protein
VTQNTTTTFSGGAFAASLRSAAFMLHQIVLSLFHSVITGTLYPQKSVILSYSYFTFVVTVTHLYLFKNIL